MKVYISADIEGVAGIAAPEECDPKQRDYAPFARQMNREVAAACEGAIAAGATTVLVKDAHYTARNIDHAALPRGVELIRGWSGHPYVMMDGLTKDFVGCCFIGYHSRAGSNGNPLAHTLSGQTVFELRINGVPASEFRLNALTAQMLGVAPLFLSGDAALCQESQRYYEKLACVEAFVGKAKAVHSRHPDEVVEAIRAGVEEAVLGRAEAICPPLPEHFVAEVEFKRPVEAYRKSFYPGASLENERIVRFESEQWFEVLRMISFVV